MDYATKIIVMSIITATIFLLLTQLELLQGLFNTILDVGKSIINPIKDLIGNFI